MSFHDKHFQPEAVDEQIEGLLHTVFPQSKATEASTRLVRELQALSRADQARLQKIRARLAEHVGEVRGNTIPVEIQDYQDTRQVSTSSYPERLLKLKKGKGKLISTLAGLVAVLIIASSAVIFAQIRARNDVTSYQLQSLHTPSQSTTSSPHISGSGLIYAAKQTVISFPMDGRVINVLVKPGDQVTPRQPLLQLDPEPLNAQVQQAQANLTAAQAHYDLTVATKGTAAEIANAQTLLTRANNQLVMLQTQLSSPFVQNGKLLAPQAGIVAGVYIKPGEAFQATTPLMTIGDESELVVHAKIASVYFGRVSVGQTVTVKVGGLPGEGVPGTVVSITPIQQPDPYFDVWITVTRSKGTAPWRITLGETALVDIPVHN